MASSQGPESDQPRPRGAKHQQSLSNSVKDAARRGSPATSLPAGVFSRSSRSSTDRVSTCLGMLSELGQKDSSAAEFSQRVRDAIVKDAQLSVAQLSRLADWFHEVAAEVHLDAAMGSTTVVVGSSEPPKAAAAAFEPDSTNRNGSILVVGGIAMDMIGEVVHFPTPNSTLEASDFRTAPGGKGGNEAVACGRLGSPVYIVGRVGNDDFGRTLTKQLSECMDICDVAVDSDVSTGFALIVTAKDTLQKTNTICKGANASLCDHDLDAIARILKEHSDVQIMLLTLDAGDNDGLTIASVAALGHTAGALVILRASPLTEGVGIIPQLWKFAHIIILTETEAAIALAAITHSGRPNSPAGTQTPLRTLQECANAARTLLNHSTAAVAVIVSSAMGVCCRMNLARMEESKHDPMRRLAHDIDAKLDADDDYLLTMPSFRGPVVDVVGAVDALAGGIAAGLQHGVPLSHALVWGTACCDRSIGAPGAQDSMPTMDELCFFLETANVHVALDGSPCRGDIWPVHKPALPRGVRKLEEFLHAGKHQEFGSTLATLREAEIQERLGAMISVPLDFQGQTLLHLAVLYGDVEAVLQCLASGADFERIDNYGLTPFERCDVEMRSARKTARERFALVKFVLAVVRQVKRYLSPSSNYPLV